MNLELYQIHEDRTINDALAKIDANHEGAVFILDLEKKVVGIVTDGDIRRQLLQNSKTDTLLSSFMTRNFVSVLESTPRENVLKLLDHKIRIIPVLDAEQKLVQVVSRNLFPLPEQPFHSVHARSPVRVSFGGGGSDLTHYFFENDGAALNSTISLFAHATLTRRDDSRISVYSHDLNIGVEAKDLSELLQSTAMPLVTTLIKLINPQFGFDLVLYSDFPVGSGLGGSAVVLSSIIGCFNSFFDQRWDTYQIAEMAFQSERLSMNVAGGWQDQYATVFGGFNFMEFSRDSNVVNPLKLNEEVILELEESLLLVYTGRNHDSGKIHANQKVVQTAPDIQALVAKNKLLTYRMKNTLLRGQISDFGQCLHETWQIKKQFSEHISDLELDKIYDFAIANGASGGKILGAGGGGYFLFFSHPLKRKKLSAALEKEFGLKTQIFTFEPNGLSAVRLKNKS